VEQAGLAAFTLRRYCEAPHRLETFRDMAVFVLAAVIVAPALVSFTAAWLFVAAGWETDYRLVAAARFPTTLQLVSAWRLFF
jgi:integral membrane sensor domain MASE1